MADQAMERGAEEPRYHRVQEPEQPFGKRPLRRVACHLRSSPIVAPAPSNAHHSTWAARRTSSVRAAPHDTA